MNEELTILGSVVKEGLGKERLSGECVISIVLFCHGTHSKWWSSVTPRLQLRVLFSKQRIVHPQGEGGLTPKERPQSSFYTFCLLPPEPALGQFS